MPYESKAERERPLWMTLVEAVEHVQAHLAQEGCGELAALTQLRMACREGEISTPLGSHATCFGKSNPRDGKRAVSAGGQ